MWNMAERLAHSKLMFIIICIEYYPCYSHYIYASRKYQRLWIRNKSMGYSFLIYKMGGLAQVICDILWFSYPGENSLLLIFASCQEGES